MAICFPDKPSRCRNDQVYLRLSYFLFPQEGVKEDAGDRRRQYSHPARSSVVQSRRRKSNVTVYAIIQQSYNLTFLLLSYGPPPCSNGPAFVFNLILRYLFIQLLTLLD